MSNIHASYTQQHHTTSNQQFDKDSKINIEIISSSDEKEDNLSSKHKNQSSYFDDKSTIQPTQKKINSEIKISHTLSQPKSKVGISPKKQSGRYKELIHVSQKRLAQSLKRIALGNQAKKQSKKIKSFEMPFTFISQSVDFAKLNNIEQKNSASPKMPDLLKIKLKKQLQSIQKNQKPKKPHFMRNHNKNHIKRQGTPQLFLQCQLSQFEETNRHEKAKERAKRNILNERKFSNFKKVQKNQKKERISITIDHFKDTLDFRQWEKRTINQKTIDPNRYLGNQRNQAKYSRLLEYAQMAKQSELDVSVQKRKSRIKTQASSALYTSLIGADVNLLQLEGTRIRDSWSKIDRPEQTSMMMIGPKLRNGRGTPVEHRPKINMFQKLMNSENGTKGTKNEKSLNVKNMEISPWGNSNRQREDEAD